MAIHFSILAWRIPWTEEFGRPQSMGWHRVRHDWATNTHMNQWVDVSFPNEAYSRSFWMAHLVLASIATSHNIVWVSVSQTYLTMEHCSLRTFIKVLREGWFGNMVWGQSCLKMWFCLIWGNILEKNVSGMMQRPNRFCPFLWMDFTTAFQYFNICIIFSTHSLLKPWLPW